MRSSHALLLGPACLIQAAALAAAVATETGVWASSTITLDSFCLSEARSPAGDDLISGIGEGFDTGINNFTFATLIDGGVAFAGSSVFSGFGPSAQMLRGSRIVIEGTSETRIEPGPEWTVGVAQGRSSVRYDFLLPFGGRYRVLGGSFQRASQSGLMFVSLEGPANATVFSFGDPTDQPLGTFGTVPPGAYSFVFGSSIENALGSAAGLSGRVSFTFDLLLLANESCPGDLNIDASVDDLDFASFAHAYNLLDCAAAPMPTDCPADLDFDGVVDDTDFVRFAVAYENLLCP